MRVVAKGGATQITGHLMQGGLSFIYSSLSRSGSWVPLITGSSGRRSRRLPSLAARPRRLSYSAMRLQLGLGPTLGA